MFCKNPLRNNPGCNRPIGCLDDAFVVAEQPAGPRMRPAYRARRSRSADPGSTTTMRHESTPGIGRRGQGFSRKRLQPFAAR